MKIKVKAKKQWSKVDREKVKIAAAWLAKHLGVPEPAIYLTGKLEEDFLAFALDTNKVFLSPCKGGDFLQTLCHEFVHLQQFHTRKLEYRGEITLWKRKISREEDYWKQPWEKEAYDREKKLRKKLRRNLGL